MKNLPFHFLGVSLIIGLVVVAALVAVLYKKAEFEKKPEESRTQYLSRVCNNNLMYRMNPDQLGECIGFLSEK